MGFTHCNAPERIVIKKSNSQDRKFRLAVAPYGA
jgi:hypothetical protein